MMVGVFQEEANNGPMTTKRNAMAQQFYRGTPSA
jgi:hypothetical protein